MSGAPKVLALAALEAALAARRARGERVVLANGVFDLLHVGHVRMLAAARALGDCLVVAVNGDASVRAARGPGRPLVPARERAELLAALAVVDHVVVFDEPDVGALLERLRPDIHAKGRDYAEATLPERALGARLGVEAAFVGDEKRHSTSALLRAAAHRAEPPDRMRPESGPGHRGFVQRRRRAALARAGWLDLARLVGAEDGEVVERGTGRFVRRLVLLGRTVYLKVGDPLQRRRSPILELQHNLALRAAGFRAPEPWLALEGRVGGRPVGALVLAEAPGPALDVWARTVLPGLSAAEQRAAADGLGGCLRALHTARFYPRDLTAWHVVVDGSPAAGARDLVFLDLMRLKRGGPRPAPRRAARGLAALSLSLAGGVPARLELRTLRAYLGGTLAGARPWLRRLTRARARLRPKGTFRTPR